MVGRCVKNQDWQHCFFYVFPSFSAKFSFFCTLHFVIATRLRRTWFSRASSHSSAWFVEIQPWSSVPWTSLGTRQELKQANKWRSWSVKTCNEWIFFTYIYIDTFRRFWAYAQWINMRWNVWKSVEMSKSKLLQHVEAKLLKLWGNRGEPVWPVWPVWPSPKGDDGHRRLPTHRSSAHDVSGGFRMCGETTEKQHATEILILYWNHLKSCSLTVCGNGQSFTFCL